MDPEEPPDLLGAPFYDEEDLFWAGEQLKDLGKRLVFDALALWEAFGFFCSRIGKVLSELGQDLYLFGRIVWFLSIRIVTTLLVGCLGCLVLLYCLTCELLLLLQAELFPGLLFSVAFS